MTEIPKKDLSPPACKGTYAFVSLGCPKNLVDSERMLGLLQIDGYRLVPEPAGADFVVVNTCGFIERARDESFAAIDEMLALKQQGRLRGVIVSGCLAERQREQLLADRPGIDSLVGVFAREEVTRVADRLIGHLDEQRAVFQPAPIRPLVDTDRLRITPRHFAYLKISEGCDRLCTFCAIPKMRGKHATKPIEEVIREAEQLAAGRRPRADHRRPGHDLLWPGLVRRAAAGRVAAAPGASRRHRLDSPDVLLSDVRRRRVDRDDCRLGKDRPVPRHAPAAHQRRNASPHGPPGHARANRGIAGQAALPHSRPDAADDADHRFSGRDRRAIRGAT